MNKINWPKIDSDHLIVYSKQMLEIEKEAFLRGMPEEALMEKVGIKICEWLENKEDLLKNGITIFIGPGHNGGDGAVVARELFLKGFDVDVFCPLPLKKELTIKHFNYITSLGIKNLNKMPDSQNNRLWIDALLGNNQKKSFSEEIIKLFNKKYQTYSNKIVAIDVPTGLCPDSGVTFSGEAIKSNFTLCVGFKKIGILQDSAIPYVGEVNNIDIGLGGFCSFIKKQPYVSISKKDIKKLKLFLPPKNASKYKRGKTLLIAGSEKYLGASSLVVKGAMASGVGSIRALIPKDMAKSLWQVEPEVVLEGYLEQSSEGNSLIYSSLKKIDLNRYESIVLGPGIGIDVLDWEKAIKYLLKFKGLLILDADILNRISYSKLGCQFFLERKFKTWITPHLKEFERLFPNMSGINNVELALSAAKKYKISILLKGANSIIADNNGQIWQIYSTDADSARAGLGDLLSGFLSGMAALEISSGEKLLTDSFAKYLLIHSCAASNSLDGSSASIIGNKLSKIVRQIKMGQMF